MCRARWLRELGFGFILGVTILGCSGKKPGGEEPVKASAQALTPGPSFTLELPPNLTAGGAGLTAKGGSLLVGDRVQVKQPSGAFAGVVSLTTTTTLSPDAKTGDLWSKGSVDLRDRSEVHGYLKTAGTLTRGINTVVTGQIQSGVALTDPMLPTVSVQFMDGAADFTVANDQTRTMAPGDYGAVLIRARGTLSVSAGEYRFYSLNGEPDATMRADTSGGEVRVFVRQSLDWQSSLTFAAGNPGKILLGYVGTTATIVTAPFMGTFLVPNAQLTLETLPAGYSGAFFGKGLTVHPDVVVTALAFRPPCEGVNTDDGNACTTDACDPVTGAVTHTPVANGTSCSDGNACTRTDTCQSGTCTGNNPVVCTALDQCHTAGTCNTSTGVCSNPTKANGAACSDANACTQTDTCQSGTCTGTNSVVCTALDQCHIAGTCNTSTGTCSNPTKVNGTACNDSNACTQTDTCQSGTCTGTNSVVCTALDQCHTAGTCNTSTGVCSNPTKANGTACNDSNACTQSDTCQSGTCTGASPVTCSAQDQCHVAGTCNTSTGLCSNPNKADGTACSDGNACTQTDTCQSGSCTGANPVVCTAQDQCHTVGTCNTSTGVCSNPNKADGTACSDGNACTQTDTCQVGTCSGSNPVTCAPTDQCHAAGTCDPSSGTCSNPQKANGTACSDGNACTQTDTCQSGACTGGNVVTCTASDQCHVAGTCDPSTGACSNPTRADGTACNDGNACTQTDACQSGACTGGNPITCSAQDQCHQAGVCDTSTGACSNPARPNGTACDDGNACTRADACEDGSCSGTEPVICTAADQCHSIGTCDPSTGACSDPTKANGTPCNDGNACTQVDTCESGVCAGAFPVTCTAGDECRAGGTCDPQTGTCSGAVRPDGSPCSDGDPCTTGEACQSGSCTGGTPVLTADLNPCTADSCDPIFGVEHAPVPAGTACDDGNACNGLDACDAAGTCVSGTPPIIDDGNPCTIDSCDPVAGVSHTAVPNGTSCDDATVCDGHETCDATGHCLDGTRLVLDDGNPCTVDTCDPTSGVSHVPAAPGSSCEDLNICNGHETCNSSGLCSPGIALQVDDGNPCTADRCDPVVGVLHTNAPAGILCSDGDPCNGQETCDGHGSCRAGTAPAVDDENPCTVDSCTSTAGILHTPVATGTPCEDTNLCNGVEACDGSGRCVRGIAPVVDDGNACTTDSCDPIAGVIHLRVTVQDDGNPCTTERCDPTTGLVIDFATALTPCSDGDACNGAEICDGKGTCLPGLPLRVDDGNPCTQDFCDPLAGTAVHVNLPPNDPCNVSGDLCAPGGTCDANGSCILTSPPVVVSDQNPCTTDFCDPVTGQTQHILLPAGTSCDDGNACDGDADLCNSAGTCTGSGNVQLDDGDPCTVDFCDPTLGIVHAPAPVGTECAPGLACDASAHCTTQPATDCAAYCQAQVDCGTESRDTHYGRCVDVCSALKQNICADKWRTFLACAERSAVHCGTGFEEGLKSRTGGAEFLDCAAQYADFSACHAACDMARDPFFFGDQVDYQELTGFPTVDPGCAEPVCVSNQYVDWRFAPVGTPCAPEHAGHDDIFGCNTATACDGAGHCVAHGDNVRDSTECLVPGGQGYCSSGRCYQNIAWLNACWASVTDSMGEQGVWRLPEGAPCQPFVDESISPNPSCFSPGRCDAFGICLAVPLPLGTGCEEGCGNAGVCSGTGICAIEESLPIFDGNPCTTDICDTSTGYEIRHVVTAGASCDDGNPCNGAGETCNDAGACVPETPPPELDDGNPCTFDLCDPVDGSLFHFPFFAGYPCADSNPCNGSETCDGNGHCQAGTVPLPANDGNPCTVDSCDPVTGSALFVPTATGTPCGNENPCDGAEVCDGAGQCLPGVPTLDDGNPCTDDTCDPATGVSHTPKDVGDGNPCTEDICDPVAGISHPLRPAGSSCSDGNACNGAETCDATGHCQAGLAVVATSDGNPCTLDICDPANGSTEHPATRGGTLCSDGNACNGQEVCDGAGTCVAGVAPTIDDGDSCTTDSCDPTLGVLHVSSGVSGCTAVAWRQTYDTMPSPRDSAVGIFEPTLQELVLFGGENAGVALSDTWIWHRGSGAWEKSGARGPAPRSGGAMVFDAARRKAVLFGGVTGAFADARYPSDVWEYDVLANTWEERPASTLGPPGRVYPAVGFDSIRGRMLVFGGRGETELADTWEWDAQSAGWTRRAESGPPPRHGAAMAFDPVRSRFVLFGGVPQMASGVALDDTWEFDPAAGQWTSVTAAVRPTARTGHAMVYDYGRQRILIHGGSGADELTLGDSWEYDPISRDWASLNAEPGPPPRAGHIAVADPESKRTVVAGGLRYSSDGRVTPALSDIWEYDGVTNAWTRRSSTFAPSVVTLGVAYDATRGLLYFRFSDGESTFNRRGGGLWQYDLQNRTWNAALEAAPNTFDGKLIYDESAQRVLFVGMNFKNNAPVYRWDGATWQLLCSAPIDPELEQPSLAYDSRQGRLLLVGWSTMISLDTTTCAVQREIVPPAPERVLPALAWDKDRNVLMLFGGAHTLHGVALGDELSDTWEWSSTSRAWTQVTAPGPSPRNGAASTYDPSRRVFVLFGGSTQAGSVTHTDTWEYSADARQWIQRATDDSMSAITDAELVYDERARQPLLVDVSSAGFIGRFWHWSGSVWSSESPAAVAPAARSGAAGGWVRPSGIGLMFGGTSGDGQRGYFGDTWIWRDGWHTLSLPKTDQAPVGYVSSSFFRPESPSARTGHAFAMPNGTPFALLFGGEDDTGLLDDTWMFGTDVLATSAFQWTLRPASSTNPSPRTQHAMIAVPGGDFLLFGGSGMSGDLSDTWIFGQDLGFYAWTPVSAAAAPAPRHGHAMATDLATNRVMLFGGRTGTKALRDTWEYDVAQRTWIKRTPRMSPPARFGHQLVYDEQRHRIVLTGGAGDSPEDVFEDTWEWREEENSWMELMTAQGYGARTGHVAFYDTSAGAIVSFGGLKYADNGESAQTFGDTETLTLGAAQTAAIRLFPNGARCTSPSECASALCIDGVCCNSPCGGECAACDVDGSKGTCVAATGKPHGPRPACSGSGQECDLQCNGFDMTACHMPPAGAVCRPTGCFNGVMYSGGECNGNGVCDAGPSTSCEPYTCTETGCANQCSDTLPCFSGDYFCRSVFGLGRCERFAALTSFGVSPQTVAVDSPITATATAIGSNVVYTFIYKDSGGNLFYPCGGEKALTSCTWTPTQAGAITVRVEARAFYSKKPVDDFRELPVTVVP